MRRSENAIVGSPSFSTISAFVVEPTRMNALALDVTSVPVRTRSRSGMIAQPVANRNPARQAMTQGGLAPVLRLSVHLPEDFIVLSSIGTLMTRAAYRSWKTLSISEVGDDRGSPVAQPLIQSLSVG